MRRILAPFMLLMILFTALTVLAQDQPVSTEEAEETGESAVAAPPPTLFGESEPILVNVRADLELLAANYFQGVNRPEGWNGSMNTTDPQLPLLIRLDLEIFAAAILNVDTRPQGWFGIVQSTPLSFARDLRHDVELLADAANGAGVRPDGWIGGPALMKCSRATQTLVNILQRGGVFTLNLDESSPDYCALAEVEAARFSEINLLSSASDQAIISPAARVALPGAVSIETDFSVAFLDRNAALRVGVVPNGSPVTPVARSYAQFSAMVLVQGDNFLVFVDYRDTSMTPEEFDALPNSDDFGQEPFCGADWCGAG